MDRTDAEIYLERYYEHLERGDDPDTARLRIIEEGCPIEVAQKIQDAAFPNGEKE